MSVSVKQIPCLQDNYGLLLHDGASGATAAIDAPDGDALCAALKAEGWTLNAVLITHRHCDHTQGIAALLAYAPQAHIYVPAREAEAINIASAIAVDEGDVIHIGTTDRHFSAQVIATPGHTLGHIVYYFEDENILCAGDSLFSIGCGRVNETPMDVMWHSLCKLRNLPHETDVYCGHEYTLANGRFALSIDPDNLLLREHINMVEGLRAEGLASLPTTLALECAINPFLRADNIELRTRLNMLEASDEDVFAHMRVMKNNFSA
jgi:hydroxyacylglutathione hydrolase